ncbi:MAG: hypothetical protein LKK08_06940 [Bacteroidales bacterium]|nr:hypothetical protein [Bacteroidales bacterium]MCI2145963.1 hypothetical protein [Bacteroidales bacterium]
MKIRSLIVFAALVASVATASGFEKEPSGNRSGDITIFKDSSSPYEIVCPVEANVAITEYAKEFGTKLEEDGDCIIGSASDSDDAGEYEILIGKTNRKESVKLYEDIKDLGRKGYIVRICGKKLLVGGTDEYMVYCGLGYVLERIKKEYSGKASLVFPADFEYVSDSKISEPTPEEVISSGKRFAMYPVEKVKAISRIGNFKVLQGGGTDGKYAYEALLNKKNNTAVIVKIDLATWKTVKVSQPLNTGHTNDITFNPKLGRLVVNNSNDSWCGISFIDPETLTETGYHVNAMSSRGISYIEKTNQYVLGVMKYDYCFTDSKFNPQKQFTDGNPQYVTQGLFCDGTYIYDVRYKPEDDSNYITVNDIDGKYWGTATIPGIKAEAENIFRIGNDFYISYNKAFAIFRAHLLPASW